MLSVAALGALLCGGVAPAQELGRPVQASSFAWPAPPITARATARATAIPPAGQVAPLYQQHTLQQLPQYHNTAYQPLPPGAPLTGPDQQEMGRYQPQIEPPGLERISRMESEDALRERIRQENREKAPTERIIFPEEPILATEPYQGRRWPRLNEVVAPNYVCYGRLIFQQKNTERYGWDLGILQPIVSAGVFYADLITLPYQLASRPFQCYDCSAGYCLPGDPVPYLLYPPDLNLTGAVVEAGSVLALMAIFP